jgi:hypothetical protein
MANMQVNSDRRNMTHLDRHPSIDCQNRDMQRVNQRNDTKVCLPQAFGVRV